MMTWHELINRPLVRRGFKWDGTMASVRGHLSDEELEIAQPRLSHDENGPFLMLNTLHGWSRTLPDDWIVSVRWPKTGLEIYSIKPNVVESSYTVGEAIEFDPVEDQ
jgi:hypothetical protein